MLLNYDAADLMLEGALLAGLIAGPYTGAIVGAAIALPAFFAGEWGAYPSPSDAGSPAAASARPARRKHIWNFSPFVFFSLPRYAWRMLRDLRSSGRSRCSSFRSASKRFARPSASASANRLFYFDSPSPWLIVADLHRDRADRVDPDQDLEQRAHRASPP